MEIICAPKQSRARMAVFDFIEGWYNPHSGHSAPAYSSPCEDKRTYRYAADHQG